MKRFITSALLVVSLTPSAAGLMAQQKATSAEAMPKLVIGIAVDQLRTDYLYALQSRFGEDGFRRLLSEGVVYESVTFDLDQPDATATLGVLATGSYPFVSGICSGRVYNPQTLREQSVFYDKKYLGNFTADNFSPAALIGTTLGDELKTATSGGAKVYSIAPDAEAALLGAGHRGNAAFWIDNKSGKWASTTYYKEFPRYVERLNRSEAIPTLEQLHWTPLDETPSTRLDILPYHYTPTGRFDHQFLRFRQPYFPYYKTSALVNEGVTQLCKTLLENAGLGQGDVPDLLQITYYAGTYQQGTVELNAPELQDTYLRLDRTLADLMHTIDATVGLKHTLIYLTSTGDTNPNRTNVEGLSGGEFNANRCSALLNAYLMSVYGQGQWVVGMNGREIFLNHKTIDDKKIALRDVEQSAAEFVALFSGVQEVATAQQLLHQDYNARIARQRNGYHKSVSGDLIVTLQPGWAFKPDDLTPARAQERHDVAPGPAIIFAPRWLHAQRIATPVEAVTLAPTVAALIRIRAPSGCTSPALPLPRK